MNLLPLVAVLGASGWLVLAALSLADSALPATDPATDPATGPGPADEAAVAPAALPPPTPLASLGELHLLGSAPALAVAAAAPVAFAPPEPPVALELTGVLPGPAAASGLAIVGTPEGQGSYRVGAELPGGARLTAVDTRGIVLERDGQPERIDLPAASLEPAAAPVVSQALLMKPATAAALSPPAPGNPAAATNATARERLKEARKRLDAAREAERQQPGDHSLPAGALPASPTARLP